MATALEDINQPVSIPSTTLFSELGGEVVLLSLTGGTYFSLNPVGARAWRLLQENHGNLPHVLGKILEEFDVEERQAREDLLGLVNDLIRHGLVRVESLPPA